MNFLVTMCFILFKKVNPAFLEQKMQRRDELKDPFWIHDKDLKDGAKDFLSGDEIQFWKEFIPKYLKPLEANKEDEKRVSVEATMIEWLQTLVQCKLLTAFWKKGNDVTNDKNCPIQSILMTHFGEGKGVGNVVKIHIFELQNDICWFDGCKYFHR